jgi:hypothetical protein
MNGFTGDIATAAGYGYLRVWKERAYLFRMALVPIFLKFAGMLAIIALDYGDNHLRQGLILLPAMLAEGWLMAQFLRTLLMEERWPIALPETPAPEVVAHLLKRARGIVAATLVYLLIGLLSYLVKDAIFAVADMAESLPHTAAGTTAPEPVNIQINPLTYFPLAILVLASIWAFRLVWIYIPFSVLMGPLDYLRAMGGFVTSLRMLGVFLFCIVPPFFIAVIVSQFVFSSLGGNEASENTFSLAEFLLVLIGTVMETFVGLVATAAMAFGMKDTLPRHPSSMLPFDNGKEDF